MSGTREKIFFNSSEIDALINKQKNESYIAKVLIETYGENNIDSLLEVIKSKIQDSQVYLSSYVSWISYGIACIAIIISYFVGAMDKTDLKEFNLYIVGIIIALIVVQGLTIYLSRKSFKKITKIYEEILIWKIYNNKS